MSLIEVGQDGSLVFPDPHDADFYRIDFGRKKLSIYCRQTDGGEFRLNAYDIAYMTSINIAEENLILDIMLADGEDVDSEWLNRLIPATSAAREKFREVIAEEIAKKQLKLLHLSPSYGGQITIICASVDFDNLSLGEQ